MLKHWFVENRSGFLSPVKLRIGGLRQMDEGLVTLCLRKKSRHMMLSNRSINSSRYRPVSRVFLRSCDRAS